MADFICLAVASQYPEHHTTSVEPSTPSSFRRSLNAAALLGGRRQSKSSESVPSPNNNNNDNNISMHVRIVPSIDNPRRSLIFDIIDRELEGGTAVKIGRFTDRSITTNHISFKSKVVSRTHCEIWVDSEDGKLYIRDTKSSSGTFVNHARLGAANQESKPVEIHNGDIIQLGVDYQGGVEEMYRAVKMRFELNRRPQPLINSSTLAQFVKKEEQDHGHANSSSSAVDECCICLYAMAPFQALFVAPCCHSYHFKCIRPLLESYPGFQCPLCRTYSDLEASVEESNEFGTEDNPSHSHNHHQKKEEQNVGATHAGARTTDTTDENDYVDDVDTAEGQHELRVSSQQRPRPQQSTSSSSHHQPDPLDTTLVLSPSNLSGILSNPLSPSGQEHQQHARAIMDTSNTTSPTTPNSRRNSEQHNQRRNTATNFVDKLKMAFLSSEKKVQHHQNNQKRKSSIRPLSYPNLWRRDDSENEDDESDDRPRAVGSSSSSSSCVSPSSSPPHPSTGLLTRTLSAQSSGNNPLAVHLADIVEETTPSTTHELSRPVTMN